MSFCIGFDVAFVSRFNVGDELPVMVPPLQAPAGLLRQNIDGKAGNKDRSFMFTLDRRYIVKTVASPMSVSKRSCCLNSTLSSTPALRAFSLASRTRSGLRSTPIAVAPCTLAKHGSSGKRGGSRHRSPRVWAGAVHAQTVIVPQH